MTEVLTPAAIDEIEADLTNGSNQIWWINQYSEPLIASHRAQAEEIEKWSAASTPLVINLALAESRVAELERALRSVIPQMEAVTGAIPAKLPYFALALDVARAALGGGKA